MEYQKNWEAKEGILSRVFVFRTFVQAVAIVDAIVPLAETMQHHPDIEIFSYNHVRVSLTTHDAGNSITEKDISLARQIDLLV